MKTNKISSFEYGIFIYFIIRSMSLGILINSYLYRAGVDGYLCPIIGTIIGFIPLIIIIKILNYKPELNISEKINYLFGNIFGKIINIILELFFIFLITIIMWNLINFIGSQYLHETPYLYISILFGICILYISLKNINVICRVSNILFYISIVIFFICAIGLLNQAKLDNLLPFLEHGITPPLIGGITHVIYAILPLFLILIIPKNNIKDSKNVNKSLLIFYLIASVGRFVVIFCVLSTFGIDLANLYEYPDYVSLRRISTSGFFQRFESILAIQWIFDLFVMTTFIFYYIKTSFKSIIKMKNENIILLFLIPVICFINTKIFSNNTEGTIFILEKLPYVMAPFLTIIPIIILVRMKFKKK